MGFQGWDWVRRQFDLSPDDVHLGAAQFLSSHPKPVSEAIERYRKELNLRPVTYVLGHENQYSQSVRIAAARYLGVDHPDHIALTDSTTMGLGLVYAGLKLREGQEIITTLFDHFSHLEAIRLAAIRSRATYRQVSLYQDLSTVTEEEMVHSVIREVKDSTRAIGLTWVHSGTGLKLPVSRIAQALAEVNRNREEQQRVLLIVDGVHGFGVETETFPELGCDFFIAGCHKWLHGPRGTGLIAATPEAWQQVIPLIPTFTYTMDAVTMGMPRPERMDGKQMTPGGFHSLEHRWALKDAFEFIEGIGKTRIRERIHSMHQRIKEGLASIPGVTVHTPMEPSLSAGIAAFDIEGYTTEQIVNRLLRKHIVSTSSPYQTSYVRFTPGIYNSDEELELGLEAVRSLTREAVP